MSIYEYDDKKRKRHRKPITIDMLDIYILIILIPVLDILFLLGVI